MSLDDLNVLAGLASDGVRMLRGAPGAGMVYATYGGASAGAGLQGPRARAQTPGTQEAESREFGKAYIRTPLKGPGAGGVDPLGLQTLSASAAAAGSSGGAGNGNGNGNGGRSDGGICRARAGVSVHHLPLPLPQAAAPGAGTGQTIHNADDAAIVPGGGACAH
ncbi:hypothetical protein GGX14DRAFT_620784 [Mycena pura]|uniref:Uncharacterized protein n=1 Tax=Mycena pura TaxID=153505 RepID=A0AAD6VGR1_9AGAR|nr:hypothetical protein GGX14DRAFT_620784 [Mycena pura]